jgi:hypothetical protein
MNTGKQLILEERQRQKDVEGYDSKHDDRHDMQQLQRAAECYFANATMHGLGYRSFRPPNDWPWEKQRWKPTEPIRDLTKAGALWLAEIDRMKRLDARLTFPTILKNLRENLRNRVNECCRRIDALLVVEE